MENYCFNYGGTGGAPRKSLDPEEKAVGSAIRIDKKLLETFGDGGSLWRGNSISWNINGVGLGDGMSSSTPSPRGHGYFDFGRETKMESDPWKLDENGVGMSSYGGFNSKPSAFNGIWARTTNQRYSVSSESSLDAPDLAVALPIAFQDENQPSDVEGLTALKACYQQLLDLQKVRCEYEVLVGKKADMVPVFEPVGFTKRELLELMDFSEFQFKALEEAIRVHETMLKPRDSTYLDTMWEKLCRGNSVGRDLVANQPRRSGPTAGSSTPLMMVCIDKLKSLMEAWKKFSDHFIHTIRKSIQEEGSVYFQEIESVLILLRIFKTLVGDVQSQLMWGVCSSIPQQGKQEEEKENKPAHKMKSLPVRAEDRVQLPEIRFPPTRKQHCAPRYTNKHRK